MTDTDGAEALPLLLLYGDDRGLRVYKIDPCSDEEVYADILSIDEFYVGRTKDDTSPDVRMSGVATTFDILTSAAERVRAHLWSDTDPLVLGFSHSEFPDLSRDKFRVVKTGWYTPIADSA